MGSVTIPQGAMIDSKYVFDIILTPGQVVNQQRQAIDNDSDFIWRAVGASATRPFQVRFNDGAGYYFTTNYLQSQFLTAITGLPGPYVLTPQALFVPGSYIGIDIQDIDDSSGDNNYIQLVFWGVRQYSSMDKAIAKAKERN